MIDTSKMTGKPQSCSAFCWSGLTSALGAPGLLPSDMGASPVGMAALMRSKHPSSNFTASSA